LAPCAGAADVLTPRHRASVSPPVRGGSDCGADRTGYGVMLNAALVPAGTPEAVATSV